MTTNRLFKKKWRATLWRGSRLVILQVPLIENRTLFDESLARIYGNTSKVVFSQYIDENQWQINERSDYVRSIKIRHSVDLVITKGFSDPEMPEKNQEIFAFHGIAPPRLELLKDVLHYGMASIPNIIYEYRENTSDWLSKLIEWNALFLEWYRFRASEDSVAGIINQIGLISWTSDYHLSFGITNIQQLINVINGLEEVSYIKKLSLNMESGQIS